MTVVVDADQPQPKFLISLRANGFKGLLVSTFTGQGPGTETTRLAKEDGLWELHHSQQLLGELSLIGTLADERVFVRLSRNHIVKSSVWEDRRVVLVELSTGGTESTELTRAGFSARATQPESPVSWFER